MNYDNIRLDKGLYTTGKSFTEALESIAKTHPDEEIVIATHATPVRAMQTFVETGSLQEMKNIPWPTNASISVLEYDNGKWRFTLLSSDEHLENLKTTIPANV